ncbi:unnamed protein product, partial [Ixodes hexagonus]
PDELVTNRNCSHAQFIKLPRLSGRLRLPFFRKNPGKAPANGHNLETDLTQFLQHGAQPGMPTLHKLLLKQYATGPPVPGGHPGFPQASHMYPTVHPHMHPPFGMPRLPQPGTRPYGPPVFPIPGHMGAGYPGPARPFYGKPGGMMGGLPPPPPYAIMPPPPRPPPPPPPPMKPHKRHPSSSPNVVFADKEPQASSNYDSGEDDTPIIIRGRKNHHGKRRRPIVIEEDVSSEEDDARPIVVRGRKPFRAHTRRPSDEQDDQEFFGSRKRPVTYIEELPEGRPYGTRNYEDDISKPSESFMDDMTSGTRSFLRYPSGASRFFQPEGNRFDNIMASEQRTNMRATGASGFYTGSPGMMQELNHLFAQHRQQGMPRFSEDPKMVMSPHLDSQQSMGDRIENSNLFPNQLESQPIKELAPLVFHIPGKGPANPDKYVQALIVPIQGNLDQMADETSDKEGSNRMHFNPMQLKVYHQCSSRGSLQSFLCPNGTAFNQQSSMCEWWYNVDCSVPKDATLQGPEHEPPYPDYNWSQSMRNPATSSAPLGSRTSTTRAPHPPTYSSSMSFSVGESASDNPQMLASYGNGLPDYSSASISAQTSGSRNRTVSFQHTGQKVLRTRKVVSKLRAPLGSASNKSQARRRDQNPTTTHSPDITPAAAM